MNHSNFVAVALNSVIGNEIALKIHQTVGLFASNQINMRLSSISMPQHTLTHYFIQKTVSYLKTSFKLPRAAFFGISFFRAHVKYISIYTFINVLSFYSIFEYAPCLQSENNNILEPFVSVLLTLK